MSVVELFVWWLIVVILCGLVGIALGSTVGRKVAGFWLGFLLGPIGWIIVFLLPRENDSYLPKERASYAKSDGMSRTSKCIGCGASESYLGYCSRCHAKRRYKDSRLDGNRESPSGLQARSQSDSTMIEDRLVALKELQGKGLISDEEAAARRVQILNDL